MTTSPDFGVPFIDGGQAQPDVTHNSALLVLQALLNGVIDRGLNTPPGSPTIGDAYIVGTAPTGVWAGKANTVTIRDGAAWRFIPGNNSAGTQIAIGARHEGMRIWVRDEDAPYVWNGSSWVLDTPALADNSVTNAKLADMATQTIKGRTTAGTGDPEDLTASQARTVLGLATTDSPTFTALTLINGQIVFPATQMPSANANALDDYEEGTWTPILTFSTLGDLSVTYSVQAGFYTKIGREVLLRYAITTSTFTHTTASGNCRITGQPFTSLNVTGHRGFGATSWAGITKAGYTDMTSRIIDNSSFIELTAGGSAQPISLVQAADMPTGGSIVIQSSISYIAA